MQSAASFNGGYKGSIIRFYNRVPFQGLKGGYKRSIMARFLSSTLLPFLVWGFLIKTEY